ncbi:MAG: HAD family phosphatase [Acidimicrobiales bacterium]|nr:HAD family phosphatase [Acidimicrobiales bacterium]RZV47472.1 MAG: HAD family phosphatase [Acidimicrobiales bacterium]
MSVSVVVFDLGNVLITWDRALLFGQLIGDPDELNYFLDNVFTLEANQALDRGMPLPEVTARIAAAHPEHADTINELASRWRETLGGPIEESVTILRELKARQVPLYALSNWGADTFGMIQHEFDFLEEFDGLVISGREGVIKPEAEIFAIMCERHGFEPADAVFIDDSAANISAAEALGFDSLLFRSAGELREQLLERGLLV